VYIAVRYAECLSRPTRSSAGCGCDESVCEYSRVRDSFEIKLLWKLPIPRAGDQGRCDMCETVHNAQTSLRLHTFPVRRVGVRDRAVGVLATIAFPASQTAAP